VGSLRVPFRGFMFHLHLGRSQEFLLMTIAIKIESEESKNLKVDEMKRLRR
jgi:hypothetical protein